MTVTWSKRVVLRAGFAVVIAVLILSAVEAYRIQASVSRQHLEIYRDYVVQDEALSTLRRNLWLAGNYARDFFINTTPAQAEVLHSQVDQLKKECEQPLELLVRRGDRATIGRELRGKELRGRLDEFWAVVDPLPRTMLHSSNQAQFDFVQREIVPRRGELSNALLALSAAGQQKLQESEGEFANTRRHAAERLLLMLGIGVLVSLLVARISIRHAENLELQADRHYAEVELAKRELQQLSARLLEIEEEGRRRLSRELHDEIGQTLALLQIEISRAQTLLAGQPAALGERLSRARSLAERTVQTVRDISLLLRPALLDDLGLVPALQFQFEDFERRSGIACEFIEEGVTDALPDVVKTCVYRVVQEALHNCEKHSGATWARISVRQIPDFLLVEVADNGRGFQQNYQGMPSQSKGLGLLGMRERAAVARGIFVIDSQPGRGTRIALRIPLAPPQAAEKASAHEVTA